MRILYLEENQLTGSIPVELGGLLELRWLVLKDNLLTGEIPAELGKLPRIRYLYLSGNQLTGEIPTELGGLSSLFVLHVSGNRLSGCAPQALREVEDRDLQASGLPFCNLFRHVFPNGIAVANPRENAGLGGGLRRAT